MAEMLLPIGNDSAFKQGKYLEPTLGPRPSGSIRKRLLLAMGLSQSYCERKSQPIQLSQTQHLTAAEIES